MNQRLVIAAVATALSAPVPAAALEFSPRVELEGRWFYNVPGRDSDPLGSAAITLEWFEDFDTRTDRITAELFARYDGTDERRSHVDLRELYYHHIERSWEARIGSRRVFWGVTESRHLVDIINPSDFVEDLDAEAKLGQPMVNVAWIPDFGTLDLFYLPYQPDRTFAGPNGRPRFPFPVHRKEARYESADEQRHPGAAMRFTKYWGPVDIGVSLYDGLAREPRLVPCLRRGSGFPDTDRRANCDVLGAAEGSAPTSPAPDELVPILQDAGLAPSDDEVAAQIAADVIANLVLVPHYDLLSQAGLDLQWVIESLALKLEAVWREERGDETSAAVAGFEYTFGDVGASGWDVGVLGEYLHDTKRDFLQRADDEVFVATRIALNDVAGTTLLAGGLAERKTWRNRFWLVEASRRLGSDWKLSLEGKVFTHVADDDPAVFLEDQDFLTVVLERYF